MVTCTLDNNPEQTRETGDEDTNHESNEDRFSEEETRGGEELRTADSRIRYLNHTSWTGIIDAAGWMVESEQKTV